MKNFNSILPFILVCIFPVLFGLQTQEMDYKKLGKGKIIEKDGSIKKNIFLHEIHKQTEDKPGWIIYIKDESLHDLLIEKIERIEFPEAEQGAVKMVFKNNEPLIKRL